MEPLCGLVLAGGRSRRMGQPKETLTYRNTPEPQRIYKILEDLTDGAWYSIREDQTPAPQFAGGRLITDTENDGGPLAALLNAFRRQPGISWLVVPVDMPLLESTDLQRLIRARRPGCGIAAYTDEEGGFEPMPAVYEYTLARTAEIMLKNGRRAIRGLGDGINPVLLDPVNRYRLTNINTARERIRAMEALNE